MKDARDFYLRDYAGTLFPLKLNRLLVEHHAKELQTHIRDHVFGKDGAFIHSIECTPRSEVGFFDAPSSWTQSPSFFSTISSIEIETVSE